MGRTARPAFPAHSSLTQLTFPFRRGLFPRDNSVDLWFIGCVAASLMNRFVTYFLGLAVFGLCIALNIGYDLRILSPRIFTMLVIMALVTTCMTGPLLAFSDYWRARQSSATNPA
jgi:hypothetical protein